MASFNPLAAPGGYFDDIIEESFSKLSLPNLADSGEFITNNKGLRLHVHSTPPAAGVIAKGYVIMLHGLNAHCNRPVYDHVSKQFSAHGYGFIALDFHGHGRSEGRRALVEDFKDLVDDALLCVLASHDKIISNVDSGSRLLGNEYHVKHPNKKNVPFFITGHSMGGGTGIHVSHILQNLQKNETESNSVLRTAVSQEHSTALRSVAPMFKGLLMLAPLIAVRVPTFVKPIVGAASSCLPTYRLPAIISPKSTVAMDLETCWHSRTYCEYAQKDKQCGLAGEGNILMLTLYNMLCMADSILEIVPAVEFPYIILHDPSDKTTEFSGSANFYQQCHSEDKNLTPVAGGKHDILVNDVQTTLATLIGWLNARV